MPAQVFFDERTDEVVAVVIALMPADLDGDAANLARGFEQFRFQLLGEVRIVGALVDEDRRVRAGVFDTARHLAGVVLAPGIFVVTEIVA